MNLPVAPAKLYLTLEVAQLICAFPTAKDALLAELKLRAELHMKIWKIKALDDTPNFGASERFKRFAEVYRDSVWVGALQHKDRADADQTDGFSISKSSLTKLGSRHALPKSFASILSAPYALVVGQCLQL